MKVIATLKMKSFTNPKKKYELKKFENGTWYCSCPAFRFQKKSPGLRVCKHLILVLV